MTRRKVEVGSTSILRHTRYIDRRTGSNIVNMGIELSDIAGRLRLFGFTEEADSAMQLARQLAEVGEQLKAKLGDRRLRMPSAEKGTTMKFDRGLNAARS